MKKLSVFTGPLWEETTVHRLLYLLYTINDLNGLIVFVFIKHDFFQ